MYNLQSWAKGLRMECDGSILEWDQKCRIYVEFLNIFKNLNHPKETKLAMWKPVCTKHSLKEKCHKGPKTQGSFIFTIKKRFSSL